MVSFITAEIAQDDSKLNLKIAGDQRQLSNDSKSDSKAMKALSLLGATFLPGTFLASIFSMTFFDFQEGSSLSPKIWIYFAFTIPLTVLVVLGWFLWEHNRKQPKESDLPTFGIGRTATELTILSELRQA
ncbi:Protein kinase [Colletotrichum asianum]